MKEIKFTTKYKCILSFRHQDGFMAFLKQYSIRGRIGILIMIALGMANFIKEEPERE